MKANMKQTLTIPETFLGVGYTKDRAGLPLGAVRVPVPRPRADQVLLRVAASSLNPLEYKLAELNFLGRTPPVILGLDLFGIVVATGSAVRGVAVGDVVVAMADLNGDGGWGRRGWRRRPLCARERVPDRPQTGIPELPLCGSAADVLPLRLRGPLRHCASRRHRLYPGRRGRCRASRRADGRTSFTPRMNGTNEPIDA